MSKIQKMAIGIGIVLGLGISGIIFSPTEDTTSDTTVPQVQEKEESISKEDLIIKLDMYAALYFNHVQGFQNIEGDLEMQKSLATTRDISQTAWSTLNTLKNDFDKDSLEYKSAYELGNVFSCLSVACDEGIKYIDKKEYKYFENFNTNLNLASKKIDEFLTLREELNK